MKQKTNLKKTKKYIFLPYLLLFIVIFAGCGSSTEKETETDSSLTSVTETSAPEGNVEKTAAKTDTKPAPTNYVSEEEMALADYWKGSDESALAKVMKKAESGEKITIAVLGGSITQGTISTGKIDSEVKEKKCYADIFFDWWKETFPDTEFECINAGIGATDSYLGAHRVQADVLDYHPDLVLVEYAVNDSNTTFYKKSYDNLLRTIAESQSNPAILLLFMAQSDLTSAQENQSMLGFSYSLPMVSYRNVIKSMEESGKYSEKELSGDTVHPSALGHSITGEILWKYLNSIYEVRNDYGEPTPIKEDTVMKRCYENAVILDSKSIEPDSMDGFEKKEVFPTFPNSFSTETGGEIKFTVTASNIGILYYCRTDGNGGQFDVYVDGILTTTLDSDFKNGWGNYAENKECYTSDAPAEHEIIIKKNENSTGESFTILGLLISETKQN